MHIICVSLWEGGDRQRKTVRITVENRTSVLRCEDCLSTDIVLDPSRGQRFCNNCGTIIEDNLYDYLDPTVSNPEEGRVTSYSATDLTEVDKGLGTVFKRLPRLFARLSEILKNPVSNIERNFELNRQALQTAWRCANLPFVLRQRSADLYRLCLKNNLVNGRNSDEIALATVHIVCTNAEFPINLDQVATILELHVSRVHRYSKKIRKVAKGYTHKSPLLEYVRMGAAPFSLPDDLVGKMLDTGTTMERLKLSKNPRVIAGAIVFTVARERGQEINQRKLAKALGINDRSIRRLCNELEEAWSSISSSSEDLSVELSAKQPARTV